MIVRSGVPAIIAAGTVALGQAIANIVPGSISMANVISNILSQFDDGATIIIDPHTGKVYATSVALKAADLVAAVEGDGTLTTYEPDGDQSGRSLKWSRTEGLGVEDDAPLYTAVKPSFTAESLTNRLLVLMAAMEAASPALAGKQFLVIDQVNKRISYVHNANEVDARTALDAVALNTADTEVAKLSLTPEDGESSPASLPFEGGSV